jgi:hypothetical protein
MGSPRLVASCLPGPQACRTRVACAGSVFFHVVSLPNPSSVAQTE